VAVVGALALALVACDTLLGLGDYHDVACASDCGSATYESGTVPMPDAAPEAEAGPALESGADADASADAGTGVIPVPDAGWPVPSVYEVWAHWKMPNPDDASIGPESSTPLPNPMTYTTGTDGGSTVAYDVVTKLNWWRQALPAPDYDSAWRACLGLGSDWRVPARIELVSLIDFTLTPTIQTVTFLDAGGVPTWTSSAVPGDGGSSVYWVVDFSTGLTVYGVGASQVLCVSGGMP